jgi:hypothetical protein
LITGMCGAALSAATAYAAACVYGARSAPADDPHTPVQNLTISAAVSRAAGNLLYPGGTGDAVVEVSNPNAFAVTVTALRLPPDTAYAVGYRDARLSSPIPHCSARTPSGVTWSFATGTTGSPHPLDTPLIVPARGTVSVVLIRDVTMAPSAPAACTGAYFSLPSITGVIAAGRPGAATPGPARDAWTR